MLGAKVMPSNWYLHFYINKVVLVLKYPKSHRSREKNPKQETQFQQPNTSMKVKKINVLLTQDL